MIRLLISVKNVEEALHAMQAGADFIDLKDPAVGALGSLDDAISMQAVRAVNRQAMVSATVGDTHDSLEMLLELILRKSNLGVDIVKLPVSSLPKQASDYKALADLIRHHQLKLIAVMFAEQPVDLTWIPKLAEMGFYGVMLDTADKQHHLLTAVDTDTIHAFVKHCELHHLQAGLAGSLRVEYLNELTQHSPSYIGFRSGVCRDNIRENSLLPHLVKEIKDKLYKHNNFCNKMQSQSRLR
jgi:dihydroneopterin aldolase